VGNKENLTAVDSHRDLLLPATQIRAVLLPLVVTSQARAGRFATTRTSCHENRVRSTAFSISGPAGRPLPANRISRMSWPFTDAPPPMRLATGREPHLS